MYEGQNGPPKVFFYCFFICFISNNLYLLFLHFPFINSIETIYFEPPLMFFRPPFFFFQILPNFSLTRSTEMLCFLTKSNPIICILKINNFIDYTYKKPAILTEFIVSIKTMKINLNLPYRKCEQSHILDLNIASERTYLDFYYT